MATHISNEYAVALLVPPRIARRFWQLCNPSASVREHNKHYKQWPPHINLIHPFLADPTEATENMPAELKRPIRKVPVVQLQKPPLKLCIQDRLTKAVKSIQPFHVSLPADPTTMFSHDNPKRTAWIGPSSDLITHFQAALMAEFSECDQDKRPFTPHLSLIYAEPITKSVSSSMEPGSVIDWRIDKVFVIQHKASHHPAPIYSVSLGQE
jgi:2'-5' RNA ligase